MTLILETGAGVQTANSYVLSSYVTTYLTERNRAAENSWSTLSSAIQDAACIAATQYIDSRHENRLKGTKAVFFDGQAAQAIISMPTKPLDTETITIGNYTYTFANSLSALTADFEVLIGATAADTASNLVAAVNGTANADIYSTNIISNQAASAAVDATTSTQINLTARQDGESGNDIPLVDTITGSTLTGFVNGRDYGSQNLQFPRSSLYDDGGVPIYGIPRNLKWATCEYAVRAAASELFHDPDVDASGRAVKKERIGPIETEFADGAALDLIIKPYPAADYLLKPYLKPAGVYR